MNKIPVCVREMILIPYLFLEEQSRFAQAYKPAFFFFQQRMIKRSKLLCFDICTEKYECTDETGDEMVEFLDVPCVPLNLSKSFKDLRKPIIIPSNLDTYQQFLFWLHVVFKHRKTMHNLSRWLKEKKMQDLMYFPIAKVDPNLGYYWWENDSKYRSMFE